MTFYFLSSQTILIEISCGYTYHSIIGIPFSTHNGQGQRSRQDFSFYERNFLLVILPNAERFARYVFRQKCLCIYIFVYIFVYIYFCYNFFKFQLALEITVLAQSFSNLTYIVVSAIAFGAQHFEGQGQRSRSPEGQTSKSTKPLAFE